MSECEYNYARSPNCYCNTLPVARRCYMCVASIADAKANAERAAKAALVGGAPKVNQYCMRTIRHKALSAAYAVERLAIRERFAALKLGNLLYNTLVPQSDLATLANVPSCYVNTAKRIKGYVIWDADAKQAMFKALGALGNNHLDVGHVQYGKWLNLDELDKCIPEPYVAANGYTLSCIANGEVKVNFEIELPSKMVMPLRYTAIDLSAHKEIGDLFRDVHLLLAKGAAFAYSLEQMLTKYECKVTAEELKVIWPAGADIIEEVMNPPKATPVPTNKPDPMVAINNVMIAAKNNEAVLTDNPPL